MFVLIRTRTRTPVTPSSLSASSRPAAVTPPMSRVPGGGPTSGDAPLAGLAGSALSGRFRHWRGASGQRYLFSVFPLDPTGSADDLPRFEDAVVLAVSRHDDGARHILAADETGVLPDLFFASAGFRHAVAGGANEIHVHLLTERAPERAAMIRDLDAG